jgi:hypothetical protein
MRAGRPLKVSATAYLSFLRCPAQAQARFDDEAYPAESKDSFKGILVHRLIARHMRDGPIADVETAAKVEIGEALNEKMKAVGINRPSLLAPIIAEAADLYRRFCRYPTDGFEQAEIPISHALADEVSLIGKIDAVFAGDSLPSRILRDWKTGALGEPFDQLFFYALLWLLSRGELARVEAISLQTGERAQRHPTLADLQAVADRLSDLVNAIRAVSAGDASPIKVAGPWCERCPILLVCDEGRAAGAMFGFRPYGPE